MIPPRWGYALPITILSTSSRIRSAYLIVRVPGHYRIVMLSRGSHVTNGKAVYQPVTQAGSLRTSGHGQHLPAVVRCLHAGWKPAPRGAATGSACSPA